MSSAKIKIFQKNFKNKFKKIFLFIIIFLVLSTLTVSAAEFAEEPNIQLQVPILGYAKAKNIAEYIKNVYQAALYIIIPFIIVMIIAAGILWIIAGGDKQIIAKAKERIKYGFIGLGIALFSYVLLSTFGSKSITELKPPEVEYIVPIPTEFISNETSEEDSCADADVPGCTAETAISYNTIFKDDLFFHYALARSVPATTFADCIAQKKIVQGIPTEWKCPNCANVPELKQNCPDSIRTLSYAGAGTIASSGCGIASLTMVLNFYGKNTTIETTAELAKKHQYRKCELCQCDSNGCLKGARKCTDKDCQGTKYDAFTKPKQQSENGKKELLSYGPSQILTKYGLKGDILTGKKDIPDPKKTILQHLEKGHPIIISTRNPKVTIGAHFIVLIGCTDCFDDQKVKIYYRDPNKSSIKPFTKIHNLFGTIIAAFYIHP